MKAAFERLLNSLERRFGSWAVSGLIRYMAVAFFGVYLLGSVIPNLGSTLNFDWERILAGEIWRPFTFILASQVGSMNPIGILFAFFGMMIMFMFSDGLEEQWGVFRTNLYVLWGWFSALLGAVLMQLFGGQTPPMPGIYLGMSIFFAFSTYNPRCTIMLFLVIPVHIWILAVITGALLIVSLPAHGVGALFILFSLSNYLLVAVPMRIGQSKQQRSGIRRRKQFATSGIPETQAFNTCAVCGATEHSHPDTDFRVGEDGNDYCLEHLPKKDTP